MNVSTPELIEHSELLHGMVNSPIVAAEVDIISHDGRTCHLAVSPESLRAAEIDIIPYEAQYREAFKRLNLEWITQYFYVESIDMETLSHPEKYYLEPGGAIFFARCCDEIVGTCALLKHPDRGFELSKMGVTESYRGMTIGRHLALTAIEHVRALGEKYLFLETNTKLLFAVRLYTKLGFRPQPFPHGRSERYQRADTYMVLDL